jgi:hypothetical protein
VGIGSGVRVDNGIASLDNPGGSPDDRRTIGGIGARLNGTSTGDNVTPSASDIETWSENIRALAHGCTHTINKVSSSCWSSRAIGFGQFKPCKFKPQQFLIPMFVSLIVHINDKKRIRVLKLRCGNPDV